MNEDASFWDSPLSSDEYDALLVHLAWHAGDGATPSTDDGDAPALRGIGRPAAWKVPNPPESVFTAQYTSAGRRAAELLRQTPSARRGTSTSVPDT